MIVSTYIGLKFPSLNLNGTTFSICQIPSVPPVFFQQYFATLIINGDFSAICDKQIYFSVAHSCTGFGEFYFSRGLCLWV